MSRILHVALPDDWAAARAGGQYAVSSRGRTLADEGFLHASAASQVLGVLDRYYPDIEQVVLLVLDVTALDAAGSLVRWDEVAGSDGAPGPFPHIYGAVPTTVVGQGHPIVAALPVTRAPGHPWRLPDLAPYDVVPSPPRRP